MRFLNLMTESRRVLDRQQHLPRIEDYFDILRAGSLERPQHCRSSRIGSLPDLDQSVAIANRIRDKVREVADSDAAMLILWLGLEAEHVDLAFLALEREKASDSIIIETHQRVVIAEFA